MAEPLRIVTLIPDLNPEYKELLHNASMLDERWQRLNIRLTTFKVPRIPLLGTKTELRKVWEPYAQLVADTNRWLSRAGTFFYYHSPAFTPEQDPNLTILWTQNELYLRINSMQTLKYISHYSYRFLADAIDQRQNFFLAILATLLAMIGLVVSVAFSLSQL